MIIGLTGYPPGGSGKSTVADFLCKEYGFVEVALADPLKRICAQVYGWPEDVLWGPSENRNVPDPLYPRHKYNPKFSTNQDGVPGIYFDTYDGRRFEPQYLTPRHALQQIGDWGRGCYEDTWVDIALRDCKRLLGPQNLKYDRKRGVYLEDDRRTWDEQEYDDIRGAVISDVRYDSEARAIRNTGGKIWAIIRPGAGFKGEAGKHSSEAGISEELVDFCVKNDKGFGWLRQQVRTLMNQEKKNAESRGV